MELYELIFLAKQVDKARKENGVFGIDHATKCAPLSVFMRGSDFLKHFIDYKIEVIDEKVKLYKRFTVEDGVTFVCTLFEDELNEMDKEELEWCGALKK